MQNNEKRCAIRLNGEWIPVTEEVYQAWYRPIWKTFRFAYRHGRCRCPNWRLCEGDCGLCTYRRAGDQASLDQWQEEYGREEEAYGEDPSEIAENRVAYDALLLELDEIDPNGRRTSQLLQDGVDDRTAAKMLGLPRSTYSDKKLRIRRELKKRKKSENF